MSLLEQAGAEVAYHDPFVPTFSTDGRTYASIELDSDAVAASDCVVLLTNHQELDVDWIVDEARLLFDTRNATAGVAADHVHRL
jgi:UDP-N-acetyl-D-glucosamine dehydrogenase